MGRARPQGGSRSRAGLVPWAVRLLVATSMVAGLVGNNIEARPASASSPPLWSQLSPATSPAALSAASAAYDPASGQTILFGASFTWSATGLPAGLSVN
ncbi:MAG: hypothetical protein ACLQVK_23060, partial [Acidimicrobiales bacterium]